MGVIPLKQTIWVTILLVLHCLRKGVSCADKCGDIRKIFAFPGEPFTLDFYQDDVKEISLVDGNGADIARIEKGGELHILDPSYKEKLSSKGFSFYIRNGAIKGQWEFTSNVLYADERHCLQHYLVTVHDDQICSKIKKIVFTDNKPWFTLYFDSHEVKEITWGNSSGWSIAITRHKSQLHILDPDYEEQLSVRNVSLTKHHATRNDQGDYTAMVLFRNGTWCLQRYSVTYQGYGWYKFIILDVNNLPLLAVIVVIVLLGVTWKLYKTYKTKIQDWLRKKLQNETELDQAEALPSKNEMRNEDTLPPESRPCLDHTRTQ
ncbi:uncharacterized protein [Dendropsophus ebraccatus]|uniref:uncharacterized protein n=1 Tax=Dendropsophus ebraccatus TaxID=150705 RepID=UPI003831C894